MMSRYDIISSLTRTIFWKESPMRHRGDVYDNVAQYASYLSAMAQIRASATKYNPVKEVSNANAVDESLESF